MLKSLLVVHQQKLKLFSTAFVGFCGINCSYESLDYYIYCKNRGHKIDLEEKITVASFGFFSGVFCGGLFLVASPFIVSGTAVTCIYSIVNQRKKL